MEAEEEGIPGQRERDGLVVPVSLHIHVALYNQIRVQFKYITSLEGLHQIYAFFRIFKIVRIIGLQKQCLSAGFDDKLSPFDVVRWFILR